MKITSSTSENTDSTSAAREVAAHLERELSGATPDLAFLFASPHHAETLDKVVTSIRETLNPRHLLGCTGEGIIGGSTEFEQTPALTLWAASFPGQEIRSAHLKFQQTPDGYLFTGSPDISDDTNTLLMLADPYTFPADLFIKRIFEDHPHLQILGGMASGGRGPGESRLVLDDEILTEGAIGVLLPAGIPVRPLVSQGCRPIGKSFVITRADKNAILTLKGRPALEILQEQLGRLGHDEIQLIAQGLHVGIAIDARKETHERGDFLVRNVYGLDRESGAIVVTDLVRAGQTIQFHVRDAGTASEDLHVLLRDVVESGVTPAGALLFTCNGRGRRLFQGRDHDAGAVAKELGTIPMAGFFAAGEIGPIGGQNFLHGFTASMALFGA